MAAQALTSPAVHRLTHKASDSAREGISRGALARHQVKYDLSDVENLDEIPELLPPAAQARFLLGRALFLPRLSFPLVPDGIAARLPAAPRPLEIEHHFDLGDRPIAMASSPLELAPRGGHPCEPVDSCVASFMAALVGSLFGMFRRSWRLGIKRFGLVGRSVEVVLVPGNVPAHA